MWHMVRISYLESLPNLTSHTHAMIVNNELFIRIWCVLLRVFLFVHGRMKHNLVFCHLKPRGWIIFNDICHIWSCTARPPRLLSKNLCDDISLHCCNKECKDSASSFEVFFLLFVQQFRTVDEAIRIHATLMRRHGDKTIADLEPSHLEAFYQIICDFLLE